MSSGKLTPVHLFVNAATFGKTIKLSEFEKKLKEDEVFRAEFIESAKKARSDVKNFIKTKSQFAYETLVS